MHDRFWPDLHHRRFFESAQALSIPLGLTIVLGLYFTFSEINKFTGNGALREFSLKRRACTDREIS
jgi:hypothetical protein